METWRTWVMGVLGSALAFMLVQYFFRLERYLRRGHTTESVVKDLVRQCKEAFRRIRKLERRSFGEAEDNPFDIDDRD